MHWQVITKLALVLELFHIGTALVPKLTQTGHMLRRASATAAAPQNVVGSYIGAWPDGVTPPKLAQVPDSVNLLMLSFAKDPNYDGNIVPFNGWSENLSPDAILVDRQTHLDRRFLVSVGGAATVGGTFRIKSGMTCETWASNAFASIRNIIENFHLDGYEAQWEGGTSNSNFKSCLDALHAKLKQAGFVVALGPYFGGTYSDYGKLDLNFVDLINMQMYATDARSVDTVVSQGVTAMNAFGNAEAVAPKFVFGLNSNGRQPSPQVGLEAFKTLFQQYSIRGGFTWDAEHSNTNCNPRFCIENGFHDIMTGKTPSSCAWGAPAGNTIRCGKDWESANSNCNDPCEIDSDCPSGQRCFKDLINC